MTIRRIVTGHDAGGRSVIVSDGPAPRDTAFQHVPGFRTNLLWSTEPAAQVPLRGTDPTPHAESWVPPIGGSRFMIITFPPDSVMMDPSFNPAEAGAEYMRVLPGLAECFEMNNPGMHTTDSVDYGILLSGRLQIELDDGVTIELAPDDVVVQNGTRHAWRNRSEEPATMLFVLVGVKRS